MFGSAGYGPGALLADLLFELAGAGARVYVLRLGRLSDDAFELGGADEFGFATVPLGEDFGAWGAAEDAGMDEAGEAYVWDVSAGTEYAFEIPDGFRAAGGEEDVSWVVGGCEDEGLGRMYAFG